MSEYFIYCFFGALSLLISLPKYTHNYCFFFNTIFCFLFNCFLLLFLQSKQQNWNLKQHWVCINLNGVWYSYKFVRSQFHIYISIMLLFLWFICLFALVFFLRFACLSLQHSIKCCGFSLSRRVINVHVCAHFKSMMSQQIYIYRKWYVLWLYTEYRIRICVIWYKFCCQKITAV